MNTTDMAERLHVIETLLHQHRFDFALSLAIKLEEAIAEESRDHEALVRIPTSIRQRARALRWAAEVGNQLTCLVRKGIRSRPYGSALGSPSKL
jgi:hypothetical protein